MTGTKALKPEYQWTSTRDRNRAAFIRSYCARPVTAATDFAAIARMKTELNALVRKHNR